VLFGRDVIPNHHALAETSVLFDNCYVDAEVKGPDVLMPVPKVLGDLPQGNGDPKPRQPLNEFNQRNAFRARDARALALPGAAARFSPPARRFAPG